MMIDKRLIKTVGESKKYIVGNVICQWISLITNIAMTVVISLLFGGLFAGKMPENQMVILIGTAVAAAAVRGICSVVSAKMSYLSCRTVKKTLRQKIYEKLLRLGNSYQEQAGTSEIVQVSVEGVDQLETYFGSYLPQFFYAMLAPLTLFIFLCFVNWQTAVAEFICVPLIPVSIALVQTWAKKLLSKYWGQYTALGDTFLENLQGLTTLKIYQSDGFKQEEMNREAEHFRRITMKVLTMQLNSITIMDLVAYGGAALGAILSVTQLQKGNVSLAGCLMMILLSAEFFIPMRQLGSFFHIAMNGMAASGKIFRLLDLPERDQSNLKACSAGDLVCSGLTFSYDGERQVLHQVNMTFKAGQMTALVGESGCGKSTVAGIFMGRNRGYEGSVTVGGDELSGIREESLLKNITYVSFNSYLFKGTVRDNLLMGNPSATEQQMWEVLEKARLADFLRSEKGLDTPLAEKASNLSGGQCQRLALTRALLHDSPIYIFDEATSNIDVESENDIMEQIRLLSHTKTVILITHRLANAVDAECIYVLSRGEVAESGKHDELLEKKGVYADLWQAQQTLEQFQKEGETA